MSNKVCPAPECNNTVWSNKATYCSNACKQRALRERKKSGIASIGRRSNAVSNTGNIGTDLSVTAINNVVGNAIGGRGMMNGMTNDLAAMSLPYISACCQKRPFKTFIGFLVGVSVSGLFLSKCVTEQKGKTKTKTCSKPSGLQRVVSGAAIAIGTNAFLDNMPKVKEYAFSVTDALRNGYGTEPVTTTNKAPKMNYYRTTAN